MDVANVVHGMVVFPYKEPVLSMLCRYQSRVTKNYDIKILHGINPKVRPSTTSEQCSKFTVSVPNSLEDVSHLLSQWNLDQCAHHQGGHHPLPGNIQMLVTVDHDYIYSANGLYDDNKKAKFNTKIFGNQRLSYKGIFDQITTTF